MGRRKAAGHQLPRSRPVDQGRIPQGLGAVVASCSVNEPAGGVAQPPARRTFPRLKARLLFPSFPAAPRRKGRWAPPARQTRATPPSTAATAQPLPFRTEHDQPPADPKSPPPLAT